MSASGHDQKGARGMLFGMYLVVLGLCLVVVGSCLVVVGFTKMYKNARTFAKF